MLDEWLFPERCPICDEVLPLGRKSICENCISKELYVPGIKCIKCGKRLESAEEIYCYDCMYKKHLFECGRALYDYKRVEEALYRFKYAGRQGYANIFGREIISYLGDFIRQIAPDAIIPVPMHARKRLYRGYNQAGVLAKVVGSGLGIPVLDNYVKRIRYTEPLKDLNSEERRNSLKKAFILGKNGVKLSTVLIIDDIYTTGSTIDEITRVLQETHEMKTYFIALAIGKGI